jgi:hypothetical protein
MTPIQCLHNIHFLYVFELSFAHETPTTSSSFQTRSCVPVYALAQIHGDDLHAELTKTKRPIMYMALLREPAMRK